MLHDVRIWAGIAGIVFAVGAVSWTYFNWRLKILAKHLVGPTMPGLPSSDDRSSARLPEQMRQDEFRYRKYRQIALWVGVAGAIGRLITYGIYAGPEMYAALLHGMPKTDSHTEAARAAATAAAYVRYMAFWSAAFAVGAFTCFLLAQRHRTEPRRFSVRYASYDDWGSACLRWARHCAVLCAVTFAFALLSQIALYRQSSPVP